MTREQRRSLEWTARGRRAQGAARKIVRAMLDSRAIYVPGSELDAITADAIAHGWDHYLRRKAIPIRRTRAILQSVRRGAWRAIRDWCRARSRNPESAGDMFDAQDTSTHSDPSRVLRCIARLPDRLIPVAMAAAQHGAGSHREIASTTGQNPGTVSRQLHKLARHPSMIDLRLAYVVETAAESL